MRYNFKTQDTCSMYISFDVDGEIVKNVEFYGGCNGNLKAISKLVDGMTVFDIEKTLKGITCGGKSTSCSDQLATAVRLAYDREQSEKKGE